MIRWSATNGKNNFWGRNSIRNYMMRCGPNFDIWTDQKPLKKKNIYTDYYLCIIWSTSDEEMICDKIYWSRLKCEGIAEHTQTLIIDPFPVDLSISDSGHIHIKLQGCLASFYFNYVFLPWKCWFDPVIVHIIHLIVIIFGNHRQIWISKLFTSAGNISLVLDFVN